MTVYIILFFLMLSLPVISAVIYLKTKKCDMLFIRQDYTKDVRFFGHSFSRMVENALGDMHDGVIHLSRDEQVLEPAANQTFSSVPVGKLIIVRDHVFEPKGSSIEFCKEIYCAEDAYLTADSIKLRAIYGRKRLLLGSGIQLVRWADAEGAVSVYDGCDLGISVSSGEQLIIGFDNRFHRLYAPVVRLGQRPEEPDTYPSERNEKIFRLQPVGKPLLHVRYITEDMAGEDGTVPYTVMTKYDLKVLDGLIIRGDIHSDGAVRIMDNTVILGNVFAENLISIGRDAVVLGNVFTQGDIVFEEGACVGKPGATSSVVARGSICFTGKNNVYGYIVSEAGGTTRECCDAKLKEPVYRLPDALSFSDSVSFASAAEYAAADSQGFRRNEHIRTAVIPDGVEAIPESQFFSCNALEKIRLPNSITAIGAYAFADCARLTVNTDLSVLPLIFIGTSAFENCSRLTLSGFSDTLQTIEGAAFAGCRSIKTLRFSPNASLKKLGDHAFRDCTGLTDVYLPDGTEYVGISAFAGCVNLRTVSVPKTLAGMPGIAELKRICPSAKIILREAAVNAVQEKEAVCET